MKSLERVSLQIFFDGTISSVSWSFCCVFVKTAYLKQTRNCSLIGKRWKTASEGRTYHRPGVSAIFSAYVGT